MTLLLLQPPNLWRPKNTNSTQSPHPFKPVEKLTNDPPIDFNGFRITKIKGRLAITQEKQIKKIQMLHKTFIKEDYVQQRARGTYIATVSQPQAAFALSYASQVIEPTSNDAGFLNRCLIWKTLGKGLNFVELNSLTLRQHFVNTSITCFYRFVICQ
ncbi:hypothetical protein K3495_g12541 [Podosphaera aphanis]|nr:hypothetical protein K3495_g12541 [Podosphaera aphanis]